MMAHTLQTAYLRKPAFVLSPNAWDLLPFLAKDRQQLPSKGSSMTQREIIHSSSLLIKSCLI